MSVWGKSAFFHARQMRVEYAKSNRSTCQMCQDFIAQDSVRVGFRQSSDDSYYYDHLTCFKMMPRHLLSIKIDTEIENLQELSSKDQQKVKDHVKQVIQDTWDQKNQQKAKKLQKEEDKAAKKNAKLTGKSKATQKKPQQKKQPKIEVKKEEDDLEEDNPDNNVKEEDSDDNKKPRGLKRTRGVTRSGTKQLDDISEPSVSKKIKKPANKKQSKQDNDDDDDDEEEGDQIQGYTDSQQKKFKQLETQYKKKSKEDLIAELKMNKQPFMNLSLAQLIERCVDGRIMGGIPNCKECQAGKLTFDKSSGVYSCEGYRDLGKLIQCNNSFFANEIKRSSWKYK